MTFTDVNINDVLSKMAKKNEEGFPFRLKWELREVQDNFIHEVKISCQDKNAPHLLMFHGYGSSGMLFYKMIADLKAYFNITIIDFLGMGCSGRPTFQTKIINTPQLANDYFIVSTEAWIRKSNYRELVGDKGFTIVGHSFGGYIATIFAVS